MHPPVLIFESRLMPQQIADRLTQTVSTWRLRLQELSHDLVRDKPSADRWSIAEVVGHLVDSACNNHQRFIRAQFLPALTFPRYEQNEWVAAAAWQTMDWQTIVNLWASYNLMLAHVMRQIPDEQLSTRCTITPYEACDLRFLVTDYLDHLRHHLQKIDERLTAEE